MLFLLSFIRFVFVYFSGFSHKYNISRTFECAETRKTKEIRIIKAWNEDKSNILTKSEVRNDIKRTLRKL